MKIRDKLFLGFGLYILLAVILGSFAYKELRTIGKRLVLVETADDITNTFLEVRRFEKNFLLFRDDRNLEELQRHLENLKNDIGSIQAEIVLEIGSDKYNLMKAAIADYEGLIENISRGFASQQEMEEQIRIKGRSAERRLSDEELQAFLVMRRHEKNIMLYRNMEAHDAFMKDMEVSALAASPRVREYQQLVTGLYRLFEEEKTAIEMMRRTAREIQTLTRNLSKEERATIDTTIRMSINLQLIALALVVALGMVVNAKLAVSIATPIRALENITKKIAQGDFSERIVVKGQDELSSLEESFNLMEDKLKSALWSLEHTIEKLREKQAQLVEAEKLASVGKLAAGIAHEINNPLTAVLTFSNLMLEQCPPEDPRHDKLKLMARETNRARNIVRQLQNFGREIVIKPELINLNRPVSEIADSLAAQDAFKGIRLDLNLGDGLPDVYADPAQIGQVVMNMLLNAIHAITPPGRIEVATRRMEKDVEIVFSDTGSGISNEHLRRIFDPFFTTKDSSMGTGLGLAVSYGIVKKHGGDIEVASAVGKGTTFTVKLPVRTAEG